MLSQRLYLISVSCLIFFVAQFASAQTVFNPKPSFDTTPVTIKVVDVTYRIPRNYLTVTGEGPVLKLAWPNLEPLREDNRECFGSINQGKKAGCYFFEFVILGSRGSGPGGRALTNAEKFQNIKKSFPDANHRNDPLGYEIYSVGPPHARTEWYRQENGNLFFTCMTAGEMSGDQRKVTVCRDQFRLRDGNHVSFHFYLPYLEHVPEIENSVRDILESFVVTKE